MKKLLTYPITRGLCLFFGVFALLNVVACLFGSGVTNQNAWWIDLTTLSMDYAGTRLNFGFAVEALAGLGMIAWALKPDASLWRRILTAIATGFLAAFAALNALSYWKTLLSGQLHFALPVPLSALLALVFVVITLRILLCKESRSSKVSLVGCFTVAVAMAMVFPLLQIVFFGTTDYRREADAVVVLGARVFENGQLSSVLVERMETAVELYEEGYVDTVIVSGGVEPGGIVDESRAMYQYAIARGIPTSALLIDRNGSSTEATVDNVIAMAQENGFDRLLVTSSFYHIPRIKMLFNLRGMNAITVPTIGHIMDNGTLTDAWREVPAWWYYWFKGSF